MYDIHIHDTHIYIHVYLYMYVYDIHVYPCVYTSISMCILTHATFFVFCKSALSYNDGTVIALEPPFPIRHGDMTRAVPHSRTQRLIPAREGT